MTNFFAVRKFSGLIVELFLMQGLSKGACTLK